RSVSIAGATTTEGNSGSKTVTLTLTLSAAAAGGETVAWATSNGTATAGSDYTAASGTVTFAAGATSATINVTVLGDATVEPNETFTVTLSNPTGGLTLGTSSATVTITNDDAAPPAISIADVTVNEGRNNTTATLTLTLSSAATTSIAVTATTVAGTALAGSDFTQKTATVTFAAGQTSATFTVTILGNRTVEPTEYFDVNLSAPTGGATIADGSGRVTIIDNGTKLMATAEGPAAGSTGAADLATSGGGLEPAAIAVALAAAVQRWVAAGADAALLRGVTVRVEQLDGLELGHADGNVVVLDADAAGWGWHTSLLTPPPSGRIDLLSVLVHELGHVLGFEHEDEGVMAEALAPGERPRSPLRELSPRRIGTRASRWISSPTARVRGRSLKLRPRR
ncbi:MAG: hypothetical protein QOJ89_4044, partial [bacterium]